MMPVHRALLAEDAPPTPEEIVASIAALDANGTALWLMFGTVLVFFMQSGFALLEAGSIRAKNTSNILLKNLLDACIGALVWWSIGFSFAYGDLEGNAFIGAKNFFAEDSETTMGGGWWAGWMFQWAFAATAATIVSGAVAERCTFKAYAVYTVVLTGFIYPVAVHWGWSGEGFLSAFHVTEPTLGANGLIDFAGSGIVHMTGGGAALMGAYVLGPRLGRFDADGKVVPMPGHSIVLTTLGTFILWLGWYGFNPVSTLAFGAMEIACKCALTTTLAAAAGGVTSLWMHIMMGGMKEISPLCNGILGGLVAITASCSVVEPWSAVIIGIIAAAVYQGSSKLLLKLKIDDPLDASPVHFFCGAWGLLSAGLFATQTNTVASYGVSEDDYGAFYGGGGKQFGVQCAGVVCFAAWSCITSFLTFFALKKAGIARVSEEEEMAGMDVSHHGGSAYNIDTKSA